MELGWCELSNEAQGVNSKKTDSIQYKFINQLKQGYYDIIYDDDYSGEIADIVTIKANSDKIEIKFYHLKFALVMQLWNLLFS